MKKKAKRLFALVCVCSVGYGVAKLLQVESVRDKLALDSTVRLLADLLMWPIDFVRALLP